MGKRKERKKERKKAETYTANVSGSADLSMQRGSVSKRKYIEKHVACRSSFSSFWYTVYHSAQCPHIYFLGLFLFRAFLGSLDGSSHLYEPSVRLMVRNA